ncbi:MAG: hypothetical protein PVJ39_13375 [Gammaproteobacteria bacterium]|jgi:hypothetical protein
MSDPAEAGNHCVIVVADLIAKINAQRKLINRTPVEDRAISTRCTLRFNVDKQRGVDFSAEKVLIAPDEVEVLENIVNELFGVYFQGEVSRLCARSRAAAAKSRPARPVPRPQAAPVAVPEPPKIGLLSRLMGLFSGK